MALVVGRFPIGNWFLTSGEHRPAGATRIVLASETFGPEW